MIAPSVARPTAITAAVRTPAMIVGSASGSSIRLSRAARDRPSASALSRSAGATPVSPAWVFRTGELDRLKGKAILEKVTFESTPLVVGGVMYLSTASNVIFALDAGTGAEKWRFDAQPALNRNYSEATSRGVLPSRAAIAAMLCSGAGS